MINLRSLIRGLIIAGVIATPIFTATEAFELMQGLGVGTGLRTPPQIRILKDVLFIAIMFLSSVRILRSGKTNALAPLFLVFFTYVAAIAYHTYALNPLVSAAGVRWTLPFFLPFFLVGIVDRALLERIAKILAVMLVAHVAAQLFQLLFVANLGLGTGFFGLNGRVPGIFVAPTTAGFFSASTLFFGLFYLRGNLQRVVFFAAPLSILVTQSSTGLLVMSGLILLRVFGVRRLGVAVPVGIAAGVILFPLLPLLTNRGTGVITTSFAARLEILEDMATATGPLPKLFGFATNTGVNLTNYSSEARASQPLGMITDSTLTSVLVNFGLIGLIALGLGLVLWLLLIARARRLDLYGFTVVFGLYALTTMLPEIFPMNLLMGVLLGYFLTDAFLPAFAASARQPFGHTDIQRA